MAVQVLSIRKRIDIDEMGTVREVYRIDFRTPKGAVSSVRVPVTWSEAQIKSAIEAEARKLDAIMS